MRLRSGRIIKEKTEHTFEVFKSKVSDSEFVSPKSVICEDIKVEMTTLRELATTNLTVQPLSISHPALDRPLKLNFEFLNLLPKFHGLLGKDPYRFINEFIITCSTMQPEGILND